MKIFIENFGLHIDFSYKYNTNFVISTAIRDDFIEGKKPR
jgi:hypothetical protein